MKKTNKDDFDKDKTPVPDKTKSSASSTISRLESKYSDILGRRRRQEREAEEDRDKTIEPEKPFGSALTKSATSAYLGNSRVPTTTKKERTPFRLHRNNSDRSTINTYRSRPELSLLQTGSASARSVYDPAPSGRDRERERDGYTRIPGRYNNDYTLDSPRLRTRDYGYYESRDRDKENTFKSKYEPSLLYADYNNYDSFNTKDRERRRYMKYKRTGTTATGDRRYTTHFRELDEDALSPTTSVAGTSASGGYGASAASGPGGANGGAGASGGTGASRYGNRRNNAYQRSQTQRFFDTESTGSSASLLRTPMDANNNSLLDFDLYDDETKSEQQKEREARRKEIQGLIMKYAQIDDVYNRATEHVANSNSTSNFNKSSDLLSSSSKALNVSHQQSLLPLSKTQSVSAMSSSTRSRIPKTLSTFVRKHYDLFV